MTKVKRFQVGIIVLSSDEDEAEAEIVNDDDEIEFVAEWNELRPVEQEGKFY